MGKTLYFYDLETSSISPRDGRIMQFAGRRVDMDLKPVGEPHNLLIKMTDDVLPEPDAIMITGITPQQTISDGLTEAEFLRLFHEEIAIPDTIFAGYNTVRFDDEFMRFLHYRNFYDPYEWQWKDGRSRWDLLDVVRMTRALRPDGIKWPFASDGRPTNRLELITALNGMTHEHAHDALSDVDATIAVAQLIKSKQPKLFNYLLDMREKQTIAKLVDSDEPFVYSSGKYASEFEKTTVAVRLSRHPNRAGASLVYDLRYDPTEFLQMSAAQLVERWQYQKEIDPAKPRLPIKTIQYNRCPAVAPVGVLYADEAATERIGVSKDLAAKHLKILRSHPDFVQHVLEALGTMDKQQQARFVDTDAEVDAQLYDGFFVDVDKTKMSVVRAASAEDLGTLDLHFKDMRLQLLLPLYKARNYPRSLSDDERADWEKFRERRLMSGKQSSRLFKYFKRLGELAADPGLSGEKQYLLEELQLYGQSIAPEVDI